LRLKLLLPPSSVVLKIKTETKQDTKHRKPTNKFAPQNIRKPFVHLSNNNNNKHKLQTHKVYLVFFQSRNCQNNFFLKMSKIKKMFLSRFENQTKPSADVSRQDCTFIYIFSKKKNNNNDN
jgi:hypothetical protein